MVVTMATYSNWVTSTVTATASLGWRLIAARQSPARLALSVAATLMRDGLKVKADAMLERKKRRSKSAIFGVAKLSVKKTIKWVKGKAGGKGKRGSGSGSRPDAIRDVLAVDAGMRYEALARRRLDAAREAFEAAAAELREAERGAKDAERYVKSLRRRCRAGGDRDVGVNDVVFVEQMSHEDAGPTGDGLADDLVMVG